jgi:hypothetical protein
LPLRKSLQSQSGGFTAAQCPATAVSTPTFQVRPHLRLETPPTFSSRWWRRLRGPLPSEALVSVIPEPSSISFWIYSRGSGRIAPSSTPVRLVPSVARVAEGLVKTPAASTSANHFANCGSSNTETKLTSRQTEHFWYSGLLGSAKFGLREEERYCTGMPDNYPTAHWLNGATPWSWMQRWYC